MSLLIQALAVIGAVALVVVAGLVLHALEPIRGRTRRRP